LSDADYQKLISVEQVLAEEVSAQRAILASARTQATAASQGILSEPGTNNDVAYSDQRADELTMRLAENSRLLVTSRDQAEAARVEAKNVINQIPTEPAPLFEYKINWDLIDAKKLIEDKMRPWVTKKILEFLGEEEPTLIEYVCKKLHERSPPQEILSQLQHVLDEDASTFVVKLWRMLIYVMLMS